MFIDKFKDFNYKHQFHPWKSQLEQVRWRKGRGLPFIWANNVSDFIALYDSFFLHSGGLARLDVMQQETIEWWRAAKAHLKQLCEEAFCPLRK